MGVNGILYTKKPMTKKILVIEDDKDIRDTIVYVLEEEGIVKFSLPKILKFLNP